jgi:hypothetical protein
VQETTYSPGFYFVLLFGVESSPAGSSPANRFAGALKKTRTMGRDEQEDFKKNIGGGAGVHAPYHKYKWSFNHNLYIFNGTGPLDP